MYKRIFKSVVANVQYTNDYNELATRIRDFLQARGWIGINQENHNGLVLKLRGDLIDINEAGFMNY